MANINSKINSRKSSKRMSTKHANMRHNRYSNTKTSNSKHTTQDLYNTLLSIETQLKKQNSFCRNFTLAIIKGLGNAIGATIIFGALLVWARNKVMPYIQEIPQFVQEKISINIGN